MMESMPVNWEALDSLVVDFADCERLFFLDDSSSPPTSPPISPSSSSSPSSTPIPSSSSSSSYRSRLVIRQIRRSIEAGDVDAAIHQLRLHVPTVLDDRRILFWLQKQEAYEEFKHLLLALIFNKEDQNSPVAHEWSERRRFDLAGLLSSILRAHLHAYDPIFSMTLRYLISIHKVFCCRQGVSSPISDLTERLLLEDRDPSAIPQESLYEAPPFDEVDIQALAHAVELTRQGAIDSLRFAKGDLYQAFQNELCRMKLDLSILDKLVQEYCVYRGIIDGVSNSPPGDCSSNIECTSSKLSDGETSVNNADAEGFPESYADAISIGESRFASEVINNHENCSVSDVNNQDTCYRRLRRSRNYSTGHRRRKRWRGRVEELEYSPCSSVPGLPKPEVMGWPPRSSEDTIQEEQDCKNLSFSESLKNVEDHKYEIILEMRELACKGMTAKVVEEINAIDPDFFIQNPNLLFQLKQVEFLALVHGGDLAEALKVACTHLGPLASQNQDLLKPLKETLLCLLKPSEDAFTKGTPWPILATSLQVAMGKKFGIEEPQLMRIVRATLHTHNEWFKFQMCKDRFEQLLKIDQLKDIDTPMSSNPAAKALLDDTANGSQITICSSSKMQEDGGSPQASSGENVCDENAILKVMEFLALPRADAIHLLMQYNGNADAVIQQIFS
ncbi:CTLH [Musa troglodytarum]|uniref:CTLH n=1 Tax=Musa troglodytarum TaxID=320322 RepID=A0A9E7JM20_9LILI|nr:CTLH [Musa troglodytarum]